MPTPIPIIDANWVAKSGVAITWLRSPTKPRPMPMPKSAMRIGSPIARSEPKATRRITIAARMPMSSAGPSAPICWNIRPPNATRTPSPSARSASPRIWLMVASVIFAAGLSNCTVA